MVDLVLKGTEDVAGVIYQKIEGGFGNGTKAVLVKDIAKILSREHGKLNEEIMKHIDEFIFGIDIIDIKGTPIIEELINRFVFTTNAVSASKHIFIVSDSGCGKIVRILGGGLAWGAYKEIFGEDSFRDRIIRRELRLQLES